MIGFRESAFPNHGQSIQIRHGRAVEVFDSAACRHHANKTVAFVNEPAPPSGVVFERRELLAHLLLTERAQRFGGDLVDGRAAPLRLAAKAIVRAVRTRCILVAAMANFTEL